MSPDTISIVASYSDNNTFNGIQIWNLLHSLGFHWGDMDCFQWLDTTDQTDYLIWVELDDGIIGYVLPELVAAGKQNFYQVRFSLTPPRTPSPLHVFDQMVRAAVAFQEKTGCRLTVKIDDKIVDDLDEPREVIAGLIASIEGMKLKPSCTEICRVR